ncbi:MAG: lysine--tRNA ligase [Candidatus Brennerbacteria bacterium]|nr:lysine--tRNA ligase [Candidatus Brennerbacteria bacterium]
MLEDIIKKRLEKLAILKSHKINPYPADVKRTLTALSAVADFDRLFKTKKKFWLAGRLRSLRDQGGVIFADLEDESGRVQIILKKKFTKNFEIFKNNLDVGDFVETSGRLIKTKSGQKSLEAKSLKILTKSLRPLPSEWFGLKDVEERFRQRYLDFILNPEAKKKIETRSRLIAEIRKILWQEGFLEVETPMLQHLPGGAKAKPFKTHYNALKEDLYLRIAPELFLKRMLVAGFEKIFEIGRNFRNEGVDKDHNPEFTMMEFYWAYQDYAGLMKFVRDFLLKVFRSLGFKNSIVYEGKKINIAGRWEQITFDKALRKFYGAKADSLNNAEADEVFKKSVRPNLINPTFVVNHPKAISPLAKTNKKDPDLVDRFQLVIAGVELVNAFSELNDPIDQRNRLEEQERLFRAGDLEASRFDEDFIEALEYGMPPAAGMGIGIDRLAALLTNSHSIKEVIAFPALKSK